MKTHVRSLIASLLFACLFPFPAGGAEKPVLVIDPGGHKAIIRDVIFTRDGRYLVSASGDKTIRVWDVKTGGINRVIRGQIGAGDEGKIYAAALSPDNEWMAVGGWLAKNPSERDAIRLYHFPTGRLAGLLKGHDNVVFSLAFSPDSRFLASGSADKTVRVWDVSRKRAVHTLKGHKNYIYALAWFPDGKRLISGSFDHTLMIWDPKTGRRIKTLTGHGDDVVSVAVSPDGRHIVSGSDDKTLRLWDGRSGAFVKVLAEQNQTVDSLSFSPDGREILTGHGNGSGACENNLFTVPQGKKRLAFTRHDNLVQATAISPDGHLAATGGGDDNLIYLWDMKTGAVKQTLSGKGKSVWSVGFSRDGKSISWGNKSSFNAANDRGPLQRRMRISGGRVEYLGAVDDPSAFVRARETGGGYTLRTKKGGTGNNAILQVVKDGRVVAEMERDSTSGFRHRSYTLTPDNRTVAGGGGNGNLTLYNTQTGKKIRDLIGHTGDVWAVAASPDGRFLVSGSDDQTVRACLKIICNV
ncbi:MAG: WD40 repeat domain-containing protein [Deltaproteobacteria bacterium]|nr:WD40 repeat domain-containing protein [Deltaproteobacteria bacterium]